MKRSKRMLNDLDQDIRDHIQRETQDNIERGMPPDEARYAALRKFGNVTRVQEETREVWSVVWLERLLQDVRYGVRTLRKSPGFTVVVVLTIALGIGATAAIFSAVNAVLFRPLPFNDPGRLVVVKMKHVRSGAVYDDVSFPDFEDWRAENRVFAGMAVYRDADGTLLANGAAIHVTGETVSGNLFSLLGVRPLIGRDFLLSEDTPGSGDLPIVLSYRLWQQYFSENDDIIGQTVELDSRAYVVVGVMPPNFQFPIQAQPIDFWRTIAQDNPSRMAARGDHYTEALARLKPGVTLSKAQTDISLIEDRLAEQYPKTDSDEDARLIPEMDELVGSIRPMLWILLGAVGFLLLIACVNVATLLLVRADVRRKEMGIRLALGAGQMRVARQMLTESGLLVALGAGCGLLIARLAVGIWVRLGPKDIPRLTEAVIDGRVLLFTAAASIVVGVVFGVVPGLSISKLSLNSSLREGATTSTESTGRRRARNALVVAQMGLAQVLLVGAGLAMKSFIRLSHVNPGFDPNRVITMTIDAPSLYEHGQRAPFFNGLLARIRALPGVVSASAAFNLPLGGNDIEAGFSIQGRPESPGNLQVATVGVVAPGYFETMGIRLLRGRVFTERDLMDTTPVVIINETLAHRFFGDRNPVGQHIEPGLAVGSSEAPMRQIVGVVGDVKSKSLRSAAGLQTYIPEAQLPFSSSMTVTIRTAINPESIVGAVRRVVHQVDKTLPIYDVRTMNQYLSDTVATPRFDTLLLGIFGGFALVIAAVGIYGVMAYSVTHRTHEIGIRITLGAKKANVLRLVLGHGMGLALTGVGIGLMAALALTRFLSNLLYGVQPIDPPTLGVMSFILIGVTLIACYVPARRAANVDPMVALRHE
jgi:predicted permease